MRSTLLAEVILEQDLVDFFGRLPVFESDDEVREFFGTHIFQAEDEHSKVELQVDPFTPKLTIQVSASSHCIFHSTITVKDYSIRTSDTHRKLLLQSREGFIISLTLPRIAVSVLEQFLPE